MTLRRGTARSWDHAQLVHEQWLHAVVNRMHLYVRRVPTDDNVADLPSRLDFALLESVGAELVEPLLAPAYQEDQTWEVLQERWQTLV